MNSLLVEEKIDRSKSTQGVHRDVGSGFPPARARYILDFNRRLTERTVKGYTRIRVDRGAARNPLAMSRSSRRFAHQQTLSIGDIYTVVLFPGGGIIGILWIANGWSNRARDFGTVRLSRPSLIVENELEAVN